PGSRSRLRIVAALPRPRAVERARLEWWVGEPGDPATLLERFLADHGLPVGDLSAGPPAPAADVTAVVLVGAAAAARMAGAATGRPSPAPEVPDLVAVVREPAAVADGGSAGLDRPTRDPLRLGQWRCTWTDGEHAAAVHAVREEIAAGEVYQVNVVGHRSAPHDGDPTAALHAVARLPGARYGGVLTAA